MVRKRAIQVTRGSTVAVGEALLGRLPFANHHPRCAELVIEHTETARKECLAHWQPDLATVGQFAEDSLRLGGIVHHDGGTKALRPWKLLWVANS